MQYAPTAPALDTTAGQCNGPAYAPCCLPHQRPAWYHRIIVERIDQLGTLSHTKEDGIMRLHLRQAGTLVVAAAVALSGLAARPAAPARATAGGGTLLVARWIGDAKTMDPGHFYEFTGGAMATNCYDTLVTFKGMDTAHPRPDLATSWSIGGGKVFTFHLRHDVRFANGDPMTADDVVFSYRRLEYLNDNPA